MSIEKSDAGDGVCVLTFKRPPANAISRTEIDVLHEHCLSIESDPAVRAVVLRSGLRVFSAGLDLQALAAGGLEQVKDLGEEDGLFALWTLSKPTIAEVGGHAIAGGAVLALACDVRIAAEGKYGIGVVETAVGVPFPRGALEITRHALGDHAEHAILGAEVHEPEAALAMGFVQQLCEPGALEDTVMKLARRRASYAPAVYAYHKSTLLQPALHSLASETAEQRADRHQRFLSEQTLAAVKKAAQR